MDSLYVVMPAYNEEENIEYVINQWYPILNDKSEDSRIVVADSGSTDRTHEILKGLASSKYPKLMILPTNERFHGPKVMELYDYAIKNGANYVFQTDSDGQTSPGEFEAFWKMRKQYTAIIGYRPKREDGRDRKFVEMVICLLLRLYFGVKVPDANAPFRLFNTESLKKYLYRMPMDYNIPNIMLTVFYSYYKEALAFKEISFKNRRSGRNSINFIKIFKIGILSLGSFNKFRKEL